MTISLDGSGSRGAILREAAPGRKPPRSAIDGPGRDLHNSVPPSADLQEVFIRLLHLLPTAAILITVLGGCSDEVSRTPLTRPQTGRYALTGRVRLEALLTDEVHQPLGTRRVEDATGVRVRLQGPGGRIDSVLTVGGAFEFRADTPGLYRVGTWVVAPDTVAATGVVLAGADASFPDTLVAGPSGTLDAFPNPFPSIEGLAMEFPLAAPVHAESRILNLAGVPVWAADLDQSPTVGHIHWIGTNQAGDPMPNGAYWALVRYDGAAHYRLVFKE